MPRSTRTLEPLSGLNCLQRETVIHETGSNGGPIVKNCFMIAAFAALLAFPAAAAAQQKTDDPSTKIPRTPEGKPDMTGVWQGGSNRIGTWEQANVDGGFVPGNVPITTYSDQEEQATPSYPD